MSNKGNIGVLRRGQKPRIEQKENPNSENRQPREMDQDIKGTDVHKRSRDGSYHSFNNCYY